MASRVITSPIGALNVVVSSLGVRRIDFGPSEETEETSVDGGAAAIDHLEAAIAQLDEYFRSDRRTFTVPIDRSDRRGFRGEVLRALEGVGYGEVITYGELAQRAGSDRAARAVGSAMATNPVPILVPCHRVIRSGGHLGHYGAGAEAKRWLLDLEGVAVSG